MTKSETNTMIDISSYLTNQITTTPARLEHYTVSQSGEKLLMRNIFILIQKRINDFLMNRAAENRWIVMPGLRGAGKTTILAQVYFNLIKQKAISKERVLYLSLDELQKMPGVNLLTIIESYEKIIGSTIESLSDKIFLLIDEAHYDKNWSSALKTIYDRSKNVFIITTGSSALELTPSADTARRTLVEKMFPLSFSEYILLKNRKYPISGLSEKIKNAIFLSKNSAEVYEKLQATHSQTIEYWSRFSPVEIENYLTYGSLPFSIGSSRDEVFKKSISILDQVVNVDIPKIHPFKPDTLIKIRQLLSLLSVCNEISYEKICSIIRFNINTLTVVMNVLKNAEIIMPVLVYGSGIVKIRKTPRYSFLASSIRASLNWELGIFKADSNIYGSLLEDVMTLAFYRLCYNRRNRYILDVSRDSKNSRADFVVRTIAPVNGKDLVPIEVGYGRKDNKQVISTMNRIKNSKYGLVFSERELETEGDIVFVPKRIFLLI